VGIDVGIRFFLTYSEGRYIENPRFYERTLKRIKIEQRRLSRKKKGSKNWEKQRRKLAKRYENMQASRTASRVIGPPILLDQPLTILPLLVTRQQIVLNPQQISSNSALLKISGSTSFKPSLYLLLALTSGCAHRLLFFVLPAQNISIMQFWIFHRYFPQCICIKYQRYVTSAHLSSNTPCYFHHFFKDLLKFRVYQSFIYLDIFNFF